MLKYAQIKDALVIGIMFVKTEITDAHYILIDNNEQVKAGYKYDSQSEPRFYLDSENEEVAPSIAPIELTNVNVTGEHVVLGAGNIWWLPINEQFTLTANAQLEDMEMMIIIERVVNGSDVIEDFINHYHFYVISRISFSRSTIFLLSFSYPTDKVSLT